MSEYIQENIFSILTSTLLGLVLFIYNAQSRSIKEIKIKQDKCPITTLQNTITEIKTNIDWIKNTLSRMKL